MKVGIDHISVTRFKDYTVLLVKKILHVSEQDYFFKLNNLERKLEFLAGRFALKEAIFKATQLLIPMAAINICLNNELTVQINDQFQSHLSLSLSHNSDIAIAICINNESK